MHIAGIYQSQALSYIELTLLNVSKPSIRIIPRPRYRPKAPPQPPDIKKLKITPQLMPRLKPIKLEPAEKELPASLMESLSLPDDLGLKITDWQPDTHMNPSDYVTSNDYFEMVRLKIEGCRIPH